MFIIRGTYGLMPYFRYPPLRVGTFDRKIGNGSTEESLIQYGKNTVGHLWKICKDHMPKNASLFPKSLFIQVEDDHVSEPRFPYALAKSTSGSQIEQSKALPCKRPSSSPFVASVTLLWFLAARSCSIARPAGRCWFALDRPTSTT